MSLFQIIFKQLKYPFVLIRPAARFFKICFKLNPLAPFSWKEKGEFPVGMPLAEGG